MRALLFLLTLTFSCILKNSYCINYEQFIKNKEAMDLVKEHYNIISNTLCEVEVLLKKLEDIDLKMVKRTLQRYVENMRKAGGGTPNFEALASGNPGSSIPNEEAGGGSRITYNDFKNDPRAVALVERYNNNPISNKEMLKELEKINHKMCLQTLYTYLKKLKKEKVQEAGGGVPNLQATQIALQSYNFTSGNPGSSTSASKKGKSTNFSKTPGASSHYGGALPSQQVPPMHGTSVPSKAGTDYTNWSGGNSQNDDGSLQSIVNPRNPSLLKSALGFVSNLFGASQQESQFLPPMPGTSFPAFQNQPFNQSAQLNPSTNFGSSQTEKDSLDWSGGNSQNDDLYSVVRPKNTSSWTGFGGTPFPPNQSQSTGRTSASNFFSPTPKTSNFNSGNRGSSSHYGGAMPFQQAPMSGTSFSAFTNYPSNQSAQLNPSTNFGPSPTEKDSWDWSGVNSQNNAGTLESMINTRKPSSSKGTNETKTGKKPRN